VGSAAFAFGIMENLSSKLCAAAGFTCIPTHAETIAIAIVEKRPMIASKTNRQCKVVGVCSCRWKFPLLILREGQHRSRLRL
jgi:hypothetical protein